MSYHLCPSCGQKSLSVATRCPHCGLPLEAQFLRHQPSGPKPSRVPLALGISGTLAALLVASVLYQRRGAAPPVRPPSAAIEPAPQAEPLSEPPGDTPGAVAESAGPTAPAPAPLPDQSPAPAPAADSAGPTQPEPLAEPVGTEAAQRRYAHTWTNVRADRSPAAPVIRILHPGEVVLVDSFKQGWYRVVIDRRALGYADGHYLDSAPPPP